MLFINGLNLDPAFNLATEEYLLHSFEQEIFMLWRNQKSIIIGKHQNALAEINLPFTLQHKIPVLRRLSGGGTVFHDPGNINFTFIRNAADRDKMIDFRKYAGPVLEALISLGVDARFSARNDIFIDGLKVSGNAEHLYQKKKRVLHHGTLLFNSRLDELNEAIRTDPERYLDKAVNSVRSKVANICDYLHEPLTIEAFMDHITQFVWNSDTSPVHYTLNEEDKRSIESLAQSKYRIWEWNFGYSPTYAVERTLNMAQSAISVKLYVEKGVITQIDSDDSRLNILVGKFHQPDIIREQLSSYFDDPLLNEIVLQLF